jgi:hypothetical protein
MEIFATRHAGSTKVTKWTFELIKGQTLQNKKKLNFETVHGKIQIGPWIEN